MSDVRSQAEPQREEMRSVRSEYRAMAQESLPIAVALKFQTPRARVGGLFAFLTGMLLVAVAIHAAAGFFTFNITDSMPIGLYRVQPIGRAGVRAGDIVRICAPPALASFGKSRDYLPSTGGCAFGTAPLLKIVVAVGGDRVVATRTRIVVAGHALRNSATSTRDSSGRPLAQIARGAYVLKRGQLWLWTPNPKSWDSRYYGPLDLRDATGTATLLLPVGQWPFATVDVAHR